jgi:hypothetical protein
VHLAEHVRQLLVRWGADNEHAPTLAQRCDWPDDSGMVALRR